MSKDYRIVFPVSLVAEEWEIEPGRRKMKIELLLTAQKEVDEDDLMEQVLYSIRRPKVQYFKEPTEILKIIEDNIWRDLEKGILESVKANVLEDKKKC